MEALAGEMKNRLLFQKRARATNSMGGYIDTWSTLCTIWGRYRQLTGREAILQQQLNPLVTVEVIIRYRTDINTDRRLYYMNKYHNIISVIDINNRHEHLRLLCEERQSDQ